MTLHVNTLASYDAVKRTLSTREREVLAVLEAVPFGLTGGELAEQLGRHPYVVRPRVTGLVKKGLVIDAGQTRMNRAGHRETVWRRWRGQEQLELAL